MCLCHVCTVSIPNELIKVLINNNNNNTNSDYSSNSDTYDKSQTTCMQPRRSFNNCTIGGTKSRNMHKYTGVVMERHSMK